ncbi:hypothetical protein DL239_21540 [Sedimentitalea sp. CY04]|uniref:Uncharacterized protein n=1 Tax=Parasedimentitalea denitrificans TaxID=2211118 RepID=A0ABX0WGP8_9RHOB|nr:hypothetical protein [Sedimentitalea sp. CY04]NIZ63540.1 hypothetical protein [Sedimentitalea sp. CY04]
MGWAAVYDDVTGNLRSSGTTDKTPEEFLEERNLRREAGETVPYCTLKLFPAPPDPTLGWNPVTLDWDVPAPVPAVVWTASEFMLLFTPAERIAIRNAQATDAIVFDFFDMVKVTQTIRADHSMVGQGLGYLQSQDLLTAPRVAAILNNEVPV